MMEIKSSISVIWSFEESSRMEVLKPQKVFRINCSTAKKF